jgi:hypothetical protein
MFLSNSFEDLIIFILNYIPSKLFLIFKVEGIVSFLPFSQVFLYSFYAELVNFIAPVVDIFDYFA